MLHAPFSDYTDPLTGKARMMTRCGDDLPADSERLLSDWDLAKLSDRDGKDVCADCLPSAIQLVAVKSLAASFEITSSSMRKAILAMGIETQKARFQGSKRHLLAITEEDAKKVRQSRITQVAEA